MPCMHGSYGISCEAQWHMFGKARVLMSCFELLVFCVFPNSMWILICIVGIWICSVAFFCLPPGKLLDEELLLAPKCSILLMEEILHQLIW